MSGSTGIHEPKLPLTETNKELFLQVEKTIGLERCVKKKGSFSTAHVFWSWRDKPG